MVVPDPTEGWAEEPAFLVIDRLVKHYPISSGLFGRQVGTVKAVNGVSFRIKEGATFALVGESGSGKTTVGKVINRLIRPTSGSILFEGEDISHLPEEALQRIRPKMQMVFQDAASSLNPRRRVADIIAAPLDIHGWGTRRDRLDRVRELLALVELPERYLYDYPHALSGGQKQRVAIARALALHPGLLILDEPTSALDVSVQAKILNLLQRLQDELGLTYLLISHDLSVVRNVADHTAVMYLGHIVEIAPTPRLFEAPSHPYTRALLGAIPVVSPEESQLLPPRISLPGDPPTPTRIPSGCPFHPRCPERIEVCGKEEPPWVRLAEDHYVWCHLYL
ncbi:MAG: ABC transporter ATP-binding protein [Anaerolineae bacterium]